MADAGSGVTIVDGSLDFSGGVDSLKVTTIQSAANPNGLGRNQEAWLVNGTVRDGGITQRTGWQPIGVIVPAPFAGLYQGGFMYEPTDGSSFPYLIVNIGGITYKVDPNAIPFGAVNLTAAFAGTALPATQPQFFYVQGEQFLVIQIGDAKTLPLFWDGNKLRQSKGITNPNIVPGPGTNGQNELPPATCMDYYQGRIWYAQGRSYSAGDIVDGPSGSGFYQNNDSILNVTENPLAVGGDGFRVPNNEGNIRALFHAANLNTQLGQGPLAIGTRKAIYNLAVPVTRTNWIAAGNSNQPVQTVAQLFYGPVNDRSVVRVNADIYYQSLEPAIRSFFMSLRDFTQYANVPISSNIDRVLSFNNRALLRYSSGVLFDNRIWQTQLPRQTPQGVVHDAVAILDFQPISSFGSNEQPTWEGIYQGEPIFQMFTGDFGGRERNFGIMLGGDNSIQLWEFTDSSRNDFGDNRVTWQIEFPAYTWGQEFLQKELAKFELWIDSLYGTVEFFMEYRPDGEVCYQPWWRWKECSARNTCEDLVNPVCYPITPYREGFRQTVSSPKPPRPQCSASSKRPMNRGYQFQLRLTIKGWCRVRGLMVHALPLEKALYNDIVC